MPLLIPTLHMFSQLRDPELHVPNSADPPPRFAYMPMSVASRHGVPFFSDIELGGCTFISDSPSAPSGATNMASLGAAIPQIWLEDQQSGR